MTEADSIVHDPNVAVEFARQIFQPEVQQTMVGRPDFEVFRDGIHKAMKGLYTAYEIGMRLCVAQQEIEQKAERLLRKLRSVKTVERQLADQANPITEEMMTQRLISHVIANRDTASMFAIEVAKTRAYERGFHEDQKVGYRRLRKSSPRSSADARIVDSSIGGSKLSRPQRLSGQQELIRCRRYIKVIIFPFQLSKSRKVMMRGMPNKMEHIVPL